MKHFLDVGGNEGQTLTWIDDLGDMFDGYHIWLFEPSPRHLAGLLLTAEIWGKQWAKENRSRQITICPFGLSDATGVVPWFEKDDPKGDSLYKYLRSDHDVSNLPRSFDIAAHVCGIGEFLRSQVAITDRLFIVLDCEGAEVPILRALCDSGYADQIDKLMVEWHTTDKSHPHDGLILTEKLRSLGVEILPWVL